MITRTVIPTLTLLLCLVAKQAFSNGLLPPASPVPEASFSSRNSVFDEFQRDGVLDITLTTDLPALTEKRLSEEYQAADQALVVLRVDDGETTLVVTPTYALAAEADPGRPATLPGGEVLTVEDL